MATTTNYGWTTPDDTALVKDGASAIRTLGSSVDTTTKNLNPETTLGDIAYRSSTANVNTRLGLGTAGQVLTVNSGATAPEWAISASGGMTLLSTTSLTGATTTISGISGSYNSLFMIIKGVTNATANGRMRIAPNGDTGNCLTVSIDSAGLAFVNSVNRYTYLFLGTTATSRTSADNVWSVQIDNYTDATRHKPISAQGGYEETGSSAAAAMIGGSYYSNTAITSLVFSNAGGNLSTGTVLLYGVK